MIARRDILRGAGLVGLACAVPARAQDMPKPGKRAWAAQIPVLRPTAVRAEWARVREGRAGNGHAMWAVLQLLAWWREWRPSL